MEIIEKFDLFANILIFIIIISIIYGVLYAIKQDELIDNCITKNYDIINEEYNYPKIVVCCIDETDYEKSYCLNKFNPGFKGS